MSTIGTLWADETLPIRDGLYTAAGDSYAARLDPTKPGGVAITGKFDLDEFLASDPDNVTSIDMHWPVELPDDAGWVFKGEGSYGSEGFFGRLDKDKKLVWVMYFERSNPFVDITVSADVAIFTSSSDITVSVYLDRPWVEIPS
jgi:hypothetical protein